MPDGKIINGRVRDDGQLQLAGKYSRDEGERVLKEGKVKDLLDLRAAIIESLSHIDSQLDEHNERGGDPDWALRARGAKRAYTSWLSRISARLAEVHPSERKRSAVVLKGIATDADRVADALNHMLAAGSTVLSFSIVGGDVVVLATEPKST